MKLSELDYWRLHDAMNLVQAAALIIGGYPSNVFFTDDDEPRPYLRQEDGESPWDCDERNAQFDAALSALQMSIKRGRLKAEAVHRGKFNHVRFVNDSDCEGYWEADGGVDPVATIIDVSELVAWLATKNIRPRFFFPIATDSPDYLNPINPRYAPKLAAAVRAWQAVGADMNGKTPKQALAKWLREHATEFGMTDDEGKPNETGIEEAAKVANWQPSGGAPKTPGE